ncbi:MAG: DegT/DnrJ/EryC1/StrS family aminotransferase [Bryobacterales bacterium]|nr:DegT/DnrJ/EryC1/StrS family aminotransferase [Bryobacterales bacterium]
MRFPEWPIHTDSALDNLRQVLASGQWGGFHPIVGEFEERFARYQNSRYGVAMMNGTVTLETALQALDIGPGDEVIVPAISFVSTATAVSRVGAIPVFVDIEPYSFNMDAASVEQAISPATKAVIIVHFGGPLADLGKLLPLAARHRLTVIEDAAHAHGSEWNGQRAGSFGACGSFSFQNGKVLTAGEGGIVISNSDETAARVRSIANQGRRPGHSFFKHFELGSNLRITALQAAVLMAQLDLLDQQIERRTRNAGILLEELRDLEGIHWQEVPDEVNRHSWYLVLGRVDEAVLGISRNEFCAALEGAGIPSTPFYPHTLYQNPLYQELPNRVMPCPVAEASIHDAFWLPHRVLLGDDQLTRELAAGIRDACAKARETKVAAAAANQS